MYPAQLRVWIESVAIYRCLALRPVQIYVPPSLRRGTVRWRGTSGFLLWELRTPHLLTSNVECELSG